MYVPHLLYFCMSTTSCKILDLYPVLNNFIIYGIEAELSKHSLAYV